MTKLPTTVLAAFAGLLFDAIAPIATYLVLHSLGVSPLLSLIVGAGMALGGVAVNTVRQKRLDGVGILVLAEIGVSIVLLFVTKDPRLLLIKPSLYSAVGGVYALCSAFGPRPLSLNARAMATKNDPERAAAYDWCWENSSAFRMAHRISTAGWGIAFLADAGLRIAVVYAYPFDRAVALSNLPHIAVIGLLVVFSALMGRRMKSIVDERVASMAS